jgi:SAM-dependent methyltransferase
LSDPRLAEWQLPEGVPRGTWQYAQSRHIADEYDEYFATNQLFEFDEQVLSRHFDRPGLVVDFGAGTGRTLIPLVRRGFRALAVDLSPHMLRIIGEKSALESIPIWRVQANLVQLGCLGDAVADYAVCLFSTLGMIRGRDRRRDVLAHAFRILKPGGLFVVHVHNFWFELFCSAGRRWLAGHLWSTLVHRDLERGDKFFDFHDIPKMYLHTFSEREILGAVREVGFRVAERIRLNVTRQRPVQCGWFLGSLRANGWIVVCRKANASG